MRILIIKPSAMGDVIHGMPVVKDLKDLFPDAKIAWLVNDSFTALVEMVPYVDTIITFPRSSFKKCKCPLNYIKKSYAVIKEIRAFKADIVIDIQCLLRSSLLAYLSKAPKRIGLSTGREGSTLLYTQKALVPDINMHAVNKNRLVLKTILNKEITLKEAEFPIEIPEAVGKTLLKKLTFSFDKKFIILSPESNWVSKSWPEDYFVSLADMLLDKTDFHIVVTGVKPIDKKWHPLKNNPRIELLQGSTNLKELALLFKKAEFSVTNDSGPMHLSVALDTYSFVLIGPTNPDRTGPYKNSSIIKTDEKCSPCFKRICPFISDSGRCLRNIKPETVFDEIKKVNFI